MIRTVVIIVTKAVSVIIIPVIEVAPAVAVMHFHAQVAVIIIFVIVFVIPVIIAFRRYFFLVLLRTGRGKINVIGGLTGFVRGAATAEYSYRNCQK